MTVRFNLCCRTTASMPTADPMLVIKVIPTIYLSSVTGGVITSSMCKASSFDSDFYCIIITAGYFTCKLTHTQKDFNGNALHVQFLEPADLRGYDGTQTI